MTFIRREMFVSPDGPVAKSVRELCKRPANTRTAGEIGDIDCIEIQILGPVGGKRIIEAEAIDGNKLRFTFDPNLEHSRQITGTLSVKEGEVA